MYSRSPFVRTVVGKKENAIVAHFDEHAQKLTFRGRLVLFASRHDLQLLISDDFDVSRVDKLLEQVFGIIALHAGPPLHRQPHAVAHEVVDFVRREPRLLVGCFVVDEG